MGVVGINDQIVIITKLIVLPVISGIEAAMKRRIHSDTKHILSPPTARM